MHSIKGIWRIFTMWRQGRTAVSLGSVMQITHSFPGSLSSYPSAAAELPIPYISRSSYRTPSTHNICLITFTWKELPLFFSRTAWVICMLADVFCTWSSICSLDDSGGMHVSAEITRGKISSPGDGFERSSNSKKPKSIPVPEGWWNLWPSPFWNGTLTGSQASGNRGTNLQFDSSLAK